MRSAPATMMNKPTNISAGGDQDDITLQGTGKAWLVGMPWDLGESTLMALTEFAFGQQGTFGSIGRGQFRTCSLLSNGTGF